MVEAENWTDEQKQEIAGILRRLLYVVQSFERYDDESQTISVGCILDFLEFIVIGEDNPE